MTKTHTNTRPRPPASTHIHTTPPTHHIHPQTTPSTQPAPHPHHSTIHTHAPTRPPTHPPTSPTQLESKSNGSDRFLGQRFADVRKRCEGFRGRRTGQSHRNEHFKKEALAKCYNYSRRFAFTARPFQFSPDEAKTAPRRDKHIPKTMQDPRRCFIFPVLHVFSISSLIGFRYAVGLIDVIYVDLVVGSSSSQTDQ